MILKPTTEITENGAHLKFLLPIDIGKFWKINGIPESGNNISYETNRNNLSIKV